MGPLHHEGASSYPDVLMLALTLISTGRVVLVDVPEEWMLPYRILPLEELFAR